MADQAMGSPKKLWEHENPKETPMWNFMQRVNEKRGSKMQTFTDLYTYSITQRSYFWNDIWTHLPLIHSGKPTTSIDESAPMHTIPIWFPGATLNFAENILYTADPSSPSQRTKLGKEDAKIAVNAIREGGTETYDLSWGELRKRVGILSNALRSRGVRKGDVICAIASNSVDTLVVCLATTALGALFTSSSTDMGTQGLLDRLLQVRPKWVFVDDYVVYNGKTTDLRDKWRDIVKGMKGVREFQGLVFQERFPGKGEGVGGVPRADTWEEFARDANGDEEIYFERVDFRDPFLIVYSSGTTGLPKCIVHSVGGALVNAVKEGRLHYGYNAETVKLQFTTTGWIMYFASVVTLVNGVRLVMYDGSPFQPDLTIFLKLVESQRVTHLGVSPRYLHSLSVSPPINPLRKNFDLNSLHLVSSTGMPLSPTLFAYFYSTFPPHVHLANISGGTDIAGTFGICNPLVPVYSIGGIQGPSLGMRVEIYPSEIPAGSSPIPDPAAKQIQAVPEGTAGELVCTSAFPNQPTTFHGANGRERYLKSYFTRYPGVWAHGDFLLQDPETKALIFLGRSDGVLNPSGVRFGSAEIYSVIEGSFADVVEDSVCVGQRRSHDHDESVVLFIKLREGQKFSKFLVDAIKGQIAKMRSKRHVPKYIFATPEIPITGNGKKVEGIVKRILCGEKGPSVKGKAGGVANWECLKFYEGFVEIEKRAEEQAELFRKAGRTKGPRL